MKNVFNEILFKLIEDDWMQSTPKEGWRVVLFEAYGLKMRILHLIGPPVCMRIIFVGFEGVGLQVPPHTFCCCEHF